MTGAKVTEDKMIIAHMKRPTEHKRHYLSLIGVVDAWLRGDPSAFSIYAGKASSDCPEEKFIIKQILKVAKLTGYAAFIPDYNVSKA